MSDAGRRQIQPTTNTDANTSSVGAYVNGYTPTIRTEGCTINEETSGMDYPQTFYTDEYMEWRIWDYKEDEKILRLISDKPTSERLFLLGAEGYNNGVWAMNEICRSCYSSGQSRVTVSNLKRSDIESITKYYHDKRPLDEYTYGDEATFNSNDFKFPMMWKQNDEKWGTNEDREWTIWEKETPRDAPARGYGSAETDAKIRDSFIGLGTEPAHHVGWDNTWG